MAFNFIKHQGIKNPVGKIKYVVYRTINSKGDMNSISHVHMPIQAKFLDWGSTPEFRIYDYSIVGKPKGIKAPIAVDKEAMKK